ncbi:uncharacterized protein LOC124885757 [Capsicum annuum]|uniref:uncharacterized protein LOC124885757 n=1 Tax=Capsicum annuum TaxID=4072 RepID=UPI001FB17C47|nr:uncharacterized protein LOC124885757 [Capsicum annuum]
MAKLLKEVEMTNAGVMEMKSDLLSMITTRRGKVLSGPSVSKVIINDVVELDAEAEKDRLVESKKLDSNEIPDYQQIDKLTVNVPLVEALEQIPGYAKFMKDFVTNKRTVSYEPVDNLHHFSAISTRSLVQKKGDPGIFTIPCTIRSLDFAKALRDLRISINLMPLEVYNKLGLGDPTPTNMRLVIVDRSIKRPVCILYIVLVKVASFIFPTDFVILECVVDFEVPIIFGRPFLSIGSMLIDLRENELQFRLNDKVV